MTEQERIISECAYSIAIAQNGTQKNNLKNKIISYKKKNLIEDKTPDKYYIKRGLFSNDNFNDIYSVLCASQEYEKVKDFVYGEIIEYLDKTLDKEYSCKSPFFTEDKRMEYARVKLKYLSILRFCNLISLEELKNLPSCKKLKATVPQQPYVAYYLNIVLNDKEPLKINSSTFNENKTELSAFNNNSDFYKLCLNIFYKALKDTLKFFKSFQNEPMSNYLQNYELINAKNELDKTTQLIAKNPNHINSIINLGLMIGKSYHELIAEFMYYGIDIEPLLLKSLNNKLDKYIKTAFYLYLAEKPNCSFTSKEDKQAVVTKILELIAIDGLSEKFDSLTQPKKENDNQDLKSAEKLIKQLRKENEQHKNRVKKLESQVPQKKEDTKSLYEKINKLTKELEKKDNEISKLKEEKNNIINYFNDDDEEEITEISFTLDDFLDYSKSHRLAIWGIPENQETKYKEIFPDVDIFTSNSSLSNTQISGYEGIIMYTGYCGHPEFKGVETKAKKQGINIVYINERSPETIARKFGININKQ